jgi:radical SAM-linked protein
MDRPPATNTPSAPAESAPPSQDIQHRMRIVFSKDSAVKYISHLDLLRAWERTIRRAELPLAYSMGFHPHPKITIAMPLPVGCTGENEALDVILYEPLSGREVIRALDPAMPPGIVVVSAEEVELKGPALATLFVHAVYDILLVDIGGKEVERRIADLLQRETVPVEFRRKRFDLRPLVGSLTLSGAQPPGETYPVHGAHPADRRHPVSLRAVLLQNDRGRIGRPDVLMRALGLSEHVRATHRVQLLFQT